MNEKRRSLVSTPALPLPDPPPSWFALCRSPFWLMLVSLLAFAPAGFAREPPPRKHTNLERLRLARLAAVHADVVKLKPQRRSLPPLPGLHDYRCILHAHAEDSSHTG